METDFSSVTSQESKGVKSRVEKCTFLLDIH